MPRGHKYIKKYRNSHGNWTYIYPGDLVGGKKYGESTNPNNTGSYSESYRYYNDDGYGVNNTWGKDKDELLKSLRKRDSADLARSNTPIRKKHELETLGYKSTRNGEVYTKGHDSWTDNGRGEYFRGKHANSTSKTRRWRSYDETTISYRSNLDNARRDISYNRKTNTPNFSIDSHTTHYEGKIERGKKKIKSALKSVKRSSSKAVNRGKQAMRNLLPHTEFKVHDAELH